MNKKTIIPLIIALFIIIIITTSTIIYLKNEKTAKIELKTNAGIPFKWEYKIEDKSIVKLKDKKSKSTNNHLAGGPIYETYIFEGLKEGKTIITFNFVNFTNNQIDKTEQYQIIIDKNKKITIIKINNN